MNSEKRLIGHVGVDSGQLVLVDPCYIDDQWDGSTYNKVCDATSSENLAGTLPYARGHEGFLVAFGTGYGDGFYPVYAEYNEEGRVARVTVEFMGGK